MKHGNLTFQTVTAC